LANNYKILISKLDEFIRKYYKNQLIKGGIYAIATLLLFYISLTILEYFAHFGILIRTILFYVYIITNILILTKFVFIPLSKLFKIGTIISHKQAADIIGKHFLDVKDKLLNTLQLKEIENSGSQNQVLIEASINQKIDKLKPIPFVSAIDFSKNRKYLKYALPPIFFLIIILITAPSMITEPTTRLLNHNEFYKKQAAFSFEILNKELTAIQQEDFILNIKINGDEIPENAYIETDNAQYKLKKTSTILFSHEFKNIQKNTKFQLIADNIKSNFYEINVLPKPIILDFTIDLNYPKYTGKTNETLENTGDLIVPCGTKINWKFFTKDTKTINFRIKDKLFRLKQNKSNTFNFTGKFLKSRTYSIGTSNEFLNNADSLFYSINIIPDIYPIIKVEEYQDSIFENRLYFKGFIKDDYGFKLLTFNYKFLNKTDSLNRKNSKKKTVLPLNKSVNQQQFYHYFDLMSIELNPGDELEYFFEIWDNDAVNGSKSSRSQKMIYKVPTLKEIENNAENSNQQLKDNIEKAIKDSKKLQKDITDLNKKLLEKKDISWQEKKQIQDLLDKQKELTKNVENIKKQNIEKSLKEQQFKKIDENILEKQKQLEKLFEELMTDEMKELFKEFEKLLEEFNKDKVGDMLEKMKLNNEDLEKELDRNLEIFKQLEFEKNLQEAIDKLDKLAEKQEKLSEETKEKLSDNEKLKTEQEKLNEEFDDIRKKLDELDKKNKELEEPNNLQNTDEKEESIEQEMKDSKEQLNKKNNSKASKSQKNASSQMKELSQKLSEMQESMSSQAMGEDIETLREILENLIQVSFDQESLMEKLKITSKNDPQYIKIVQDQKKLKDDMQMIEDSLFALSKRQIKIKAFVNKEVNKINNRMERALKAMLDMNTIGPTMGNVKDDAVGNQQYVMTSMNNLALLLSESLEQMQQQMSQPKPGKSCNKPKPGAGQKPMQSMRQMQQQLNKQIEQLKKGKNKGGKTGKKQSMSEQLARLAAQQEAIRGMMRKYEEGLKKQGLKDKGDLSEMMKEMEKTETDLVNKIISEQTLKRQEEILTKLLKSEKAEREREFEEKRQSNEAKMQNFSNPKDFFKYKKIKLKEAELLKTVPPSLKPFYKNKVNEYFYNFEE